jgi:hypothetical protein
MQRFTELVHPSTSTVARVDPYQPSSADEINATLTEVKQLWWFHDGSIMNVGVRHHLWASWGFCSRHTWLYAISELEMRGGSLLGTAVLYEDLLGRAAAAVSGRRLLRRDPVSALRPRESCFTCDYTGHALDPDPHFAAQTERVNARTRLRTLLEGQQEQWRPRACPTCLGGDGLPCRPHLLGGNAAPPRDFGRQLWALRGRTAKFLRSQTWRPPTLTPDERIAWVETLGFFAGWAVPDVLAREAAPARATAPGRMAETG